MSQAGEARTGEEVKVDLEPYRRLVELQKQMIELSQHEQSRRECDALRAQVTKEISARLRGTVSLQQRLRTAVLRLSQFTRKDSLPC
ncbi:MAG: hypothetical protein EPO07_07995 [Verrucomicrobia bacterium]|nr:MAG: hypothetical protein EPO07_07995 [Verrucomicrobiota bacterium]